MKIGIQMCPLPAAKPGYDNSLLLIDEALRRGYEVWHWEPQDITLDQSDCVTAKARRVQDQYQTGEDETLDLRTLDVLFFRQDPPFDMTYITNTFLLERLEDDVILVNHPRWIRDMPDKLSIFDYAAYMPPTLVTRNPTEMRHFFETHQHDCVIKPLYGFKGHGIVRVREEEALLRTLKGTGEPVMVQPFLPEIRDGNTRIVLCDGEIIGALRSIPDEDFRIFRDSADVAYTPSPEEVKLCKTLAPTLKARGLRFVGIDLIGPYLTEINVGSVGSLVRLNAVYGGRHESIIFDSLGL